MMRVNRFARSAKSCWPDDSTISLPTQANWPARMVRVCPLPPRWPPAVAICTLPTKTCASVAPSLLTSTPNSVPRSVTVAVGVRTANRRRMKDEDELEIRLPRSASASSPLLPSACRPTETRRSRFHLIRHRPLQDDFRPRVVGDFHQARSQCILSSQGNTRRINSSTSPLAIDHARDPTNKLHLRLGSHPAGQRRLPGDLLGTGTHASRSRSTCRLRKSPLQSDTPPASPRRKSRLCRGGWWRGRWGRKERRVSAALAREPIGQRRVFLAHRIQNGLQKVRILNVFKVQPARVVTLPQ